jgi:adenylate kinase family enzyme
MGDKKFPKVIILVGMMGVGKTTLSFKLYEQLFDYKFRFTTEYLFDEQIRDFKEVKNYTFSLYKDDLIRMTLIASFLKKDERKDEQLLFDGFPLNSAFLTSCYGKIGFNENLKIIFQKIIKYFNDFEISEDELKNILVLNIKNDKSLEYYLKRNNHNTMSVDNYLIVKENYETFVNEILKALKKLQVNCREVDITKLNVNSENEIKKFIENSLLIDK